MSPEPRLPHRERCDTCGGHGHDPHIECMHGDVAGVCIDDLCQDGDTCPGCGGSGWDDGMADDDDLPPCGHAECVPAGRSGRWLVPAKCYHQIQHSREATSRKDDLPPFQTCIACGRYTAYVDHSVCDKDCLRRALTLRAEGEKAATERIARFAEHEATRLERRDDDYGTLAAIALDGFAHALRLGQHECES